MLGVALHGIDIQRYDLIVLESFEHARADGPRWPLDPGTSWAPDVE